MNPLQTPPRSRHHHQVLRRQRRQHADEENQPQLVLPKTIYLIRHGESQGQAARRQGMDRRNDVRLRDCPLTEEGVIQAQTVIQQALGPEVMEQLQLVVSSPLTRALQTALLAFPASTPLTVHYDLREVGSRVPENVPRTMAAVLQDLHELVLQRGGESTLDLASTQPQDWPRDYSPRVCRHDKIRNALYWFAERPEQHIAVVCHFNVIRSLLFDDSAAVPAWTTIRPENAVPITTELTRNESGYLILRVKPDTR